MRVNKQDKIRITGNGASKEQAFASAFGSIQKEVMKKYNKIMIQISPLDVEIIEANEVVYVEKFFFFFFPRQRSKFYVTLDVEIDIFFIDQDVVNFKEVTPSMGVVDGLLKRFN